MARCHKLQARNRTRGVPFLLSLGHAARGGGFCRGKGGCSWSAPGESFGGRWGRSSSPDLGIALPSVFCCRSIFLRIRAVPCGLLLFCRVSESSLMREKLVSHPGESHPPSGLGSEPCSVLSFCLSALRAIRAAPSGDVSNEGSVCSPSSATRTGAGLVRPTIISASGVSEGSASPIFFTGGHAGGDELGSGRATDVLGRAFRYFFVATTFGGSNQRSVSAYPSSEE